MTTNDHRRGRLGLIIPSTNTSVEADYNELAPPGVSLHIAHIFINSRIDEVERSYGKPLIGIKVATLVHALRAVGVNDRITGAGSVFERPLARSS
jgi:maleate isomerase